MRFGFCSSPVTSAQSASGVSDTTEPPYKGSAMSLANAASIVFSKLMRSALVMAPSGKEEEEEK
jgi:hypothetical protein